MSLPKAPLNPWNKSSSHSSTKFTLSSSWKWSWLCLSPCFGMPPRWKSREDCRRVLFEIMKIPVLWFWWKDDGTFADSHKKPQYGSNIAQQNIFLLVTIILRNEHGKIFPAFIFREFSQSWSHLAILSISCSFANNLHNRDNQEFHESAETGTLHKERTWSIALGGNMRGWQ